MIPRNCPFGFSAEYLGPSPAYDEFEQFLRIEFEKLPAGWEPTFGQVVKFDRHLRRWNYAFLLTGSVPDAKTSRQAEEKALDLVHHLAAGLRQAHANPGHLLPDPVVRVWEWAEAVTPSIG